MRATLRLSSPAWLAQPKIHVVERRPVDLRIARHQRLERHRGEIVGAHLRQRRRRSGRSACGRQSQMKARQRMSAPHAACRGRAQCGPAVRAGPSSSRAVGGGVSATLSANFTVQPVVSWICSRVTPGCIETTVNSLVFGIRLQDAEIGDQLGRALGRDAEPLAVVAALAVAERGEEIDLVRRTSACPAS